MIYLVVVKNAARALQPDIVRIDSQEVANRPDLLELVKNAVGHRLYTGDAVEDETGEVLEALLALKEESEYIEVLALDGKSLKKGGTVEVTVGAQTFYLPYLEVYDTP